MAQHDLLFLTGHFAQTLSQELGMDPAKGPTADMARFFPVFLKIRSVMQEVLEVAEFEYLRYSVETSDLGPVKFFNQSLRINPTAQFVELHHPQRLLQRMAGLYCFYRFQDQTFELKLEVQQALVVDLLQSDLRELSMTIDAVALAELAHGHSLGKTRTPAQWRALIQNLLSEGLLISSEARPEFSNVRADTRQ
jgi:hypothetical protein